jgi:hypothetical protein
LEGIVSQGAGALSSLDDLAPGRLPGLDAILDGVLHRTAFVV